MRRASLFLAFARMPEADAQRVPLCRTLEPRAHFNHWLPLYDRQIAQVLLNQPKWGDPALLQGQADDLNYDKLHAWQSQLTKVKQERGSEALGEMQAGLGGRGPGGTTADSQGLMQPPPVQKQRHRKRFVSLSPSPALGPLLTTTVNSSDLPPLLPSMSNRAS